MIAWLGRLPDTRRVHSMAGLRRPFRAVIVLGILLACCPCAFGLGTLDVSQYANTAWTVHDGFFKGIISAVAQTPDGYLWLGTEFGLLRFDGFGVSHGSRRQVSISPAVLSKACSPRGVFGLAQLKRLQTGRTAS
jgi:ligand-binding sensor domain-containing protein